MFAGFCGDGFDELAAGAGAPRGGVDEQVLKVAGVLEGPAMGVEQEVGDADDAVRGAGGEAVDAFVGEDAVPGVVVDFGREDGFVEGEIAAPQLGPAGTVGWGQGCYVDQRGSPPSGP